MNAIASYQYETLQVSITNQYIDGYFKSSP